MTDAHTDDATDEQLTEPHTGLPTSTLGHAEIRLDVDPDTYDRLHAEFCRAVDRGYSDGFDTFVFNYCSIDCRVTVDGEPVDPRS